MGRRSAGPSLAPLSRLPHHRRMRRLVVLLALASVGCATTPVENPGPSSPAASAQPMTADPAAPAAQTLEPAVVEAAMHATHVEKIKIRVDSRGAIVKQAAYHDNAAAVPDIVKTKAGEVYPGSKILHYETEHYRDDGLVHEVEVQTQDGRRCEVSVGPEGVLRYQECRIAAEDLPAAVAAKVAELYPDGRVLEAEIKTTAEGDTFTIEVDSGGDEFYLSVSPQGALLGVHRRIKAIVELPLATP